jgi:peptide/nickel transport system substrate-binding protein
VNGRRRIVLAVAVGALGIALLAGAGTAARSAGPVTLTVGLDEDIDTFNPANGALVADYDVWNLQYATVTRKAATDFHTIPGLASSWKSSNHGRTWTYTLRSGLQWSDGVPLTAADVAYTINRARKEQWLNYTAFVANLIATAKDPRTLVVRSTVPDPRLPGLGDTYIVPKHVYEKIAKKDLTKYQARDGVGSGPFTLEKYVKGQYWQMKANPTYWQGKPKIDRIIFKPFTNLDSMVFALKKGDIDVAHNVPAVSFNALGKTKGIVAIQGFQGGFDELALNAGAGFGKPHPALLDLRVRQAIAMAIDKKALISRVYGGLGQPGGAMSPSADPAWTPTIPASQRYDFDLKKANALLDAAGYKDTNGDGIREMPGGGKPLVLRYLGRSVSGYAKPLAQFVTGWLKEIGIGTKVSFLGDSQLTVAVGKGQYEIEAWGWTPFVDPDPQLSYFQCNQVSKDPKDPTNYYNDASWCDKGYDKLYAKQRVELNHAKRLAIVHQMLTRFYRSAAYVVLDYSADLQAYRTDRLTGWLRQPANSGPVIFTNTSPTYFNLRPISTAQASFVPPVSGRIGGVLLLVSLPLFAVLWRERRTRGRMGVPR